MKKGPLGVKKWKLNLKFSYHLTSLEIPMKTMAILYLSNDPTEHFSPSHFWILLGLTVVCKLRNVRDERRTCTHLPSLPHTLCFHVPQQTPQAFCLLVYFYQLFALVSLTALKLCRLKVWIPRWSILDLLLFHCTCESIPAANTGSPSNWGCRTWECQHCKPRQLHQENSVQKKKNSLAQRWLLHLESNILDCPLAIVPQAPNTNRSALHKEMLMC